MLSRPLGHFIFPVAVLNTMSLILKWSPTLPTTIYGIKNCDTMKKAFTWLGEAGVEHVFHDYKKAGIDAETLKTWCGSLGWEKVLNKAGTTFRKLPDESKQGLDEDRAIALMVEQPSMIKRPITDHDGALMVGFKPELYAVFFGKN